ncbi:MAG: hypothetical protein R3F59_25250 [Myxococcota bacterium]
MSPAGEWLIDSFRHRGAAARDRNHLPARFYRQLPKLAEGALHGYPRVHALIWAFVAHTDSRFEVEPLRRTITAYQQVQPLTIGELWAIAISLRLVLIENLRRLADAIVSDRDARDRADRLADTLLQGDPEAAGGSAARLAQLERAPLDPAFAVQLLARLRECDPELQPTLGWLDAQLARRGTTADEAVRAQHLQQIATLTSIRHAITSLRGVAAVDWSDFVEQVSLVDQALRDGTPYDTYDFATRDRYRHAVEELARQRPATEREIATRAAHHARAATGRAADPGYWLVAQGRADLEAEPGSAPPWASACAARCGASRRSRTSGASPR